MQTRNPFLDEFAKLTTGAMGLAQAAGEEAKSAWRAQADRFVADMDLVRRDEFDVLKAEIAALRAEVAELKKPVKTAAKTPGKGTSTAGLARRTQPVEPNLRTRLPS
ncbi:accessory factor UbiK family protein [Brevundimonas denitrificans]|uniref:accessory factor UbiK family protein n=1 Tax=Brevundimonas denitrificans TaxID=1443434 RepID=UPI00223AA474|nr:accessory factor UbiK family protein [Brevundimonas denitrificans]